MPNNLHISYDLMNPGQNYDAIIRRIKSLGLWAKSLLSFWYVNSNYTAEQARNHLLPVLDANDRLYVVDSTNNVAAWHNIPADAAVLINDQWLK
jgi:hypothetical protein